MKRTQDIKIREGIEKVRHIVLDFPMAMLATRLLQIPFSICPMRTVDMDEAGDLWFFQQTTQSITSTYRKTTGISYCI